MNKTSVTYVFSILNSSKPPKANYSGTKSSPSFLAHTFLIPASYLLLLFRPSIGAKKMRICYQPEEV